MERDDGRFTRVARARAGPAPGFFSLLFFRTVEPAERVLLIGRPSGLADQREVDQVVLLIKVRSLVPLLRPRLSLFSPGVPSPSHVPT